MEKEKRESKRGGLASAANFFRRMVPCNLQSYLCQKWFLLAGVSIVIAILVNPSFMVQNPHYHLGQIADRNIKAKHAFLVEDEAATAKKREEAIRQSPLVYDYDPNITKSIIDKLRASFTAMRGASANVTTEPASATPEEGVSSSKKTPPVVQSHADRSRTQRE